jgi:hypothetical protein
LREEGLLNQLTTYANLARLDDMGIGFITLRRRSPRLLTDITQLPRSAWRTVELDVPNHLQLEDQATSFLAVIAFFPRKGFTVADVHLSGYAKD